jgi:hypothetical protein
VCEATHVSADRVRVVVCDDHPLFRDGVVRALSAWRSWTTACRAWTERQVAAAVKRDGLATRVLLISAHDESAIVYSALQEGAAGFIADGQTIPRSSGWGTAATVDYFAAAPARVSALLRLPLIALVGFLVWLWEVDSWLRVAARPATC